MKRFMLFGGEGFYASGGFNDYLDSFDNVESARVVALHLEETDSDYFDWWHIVDRDTGGIVVASKHGAYGGDSGYQERYKQKRPTD